MGQGRAPVRRRKPRERIEVEVMVAAGKDLCGTESGVRRCGGASEVRRRVCNAVGNFARRG